MEVSQSGFSGCEIFYFIDSESKKKSYICNRLKRYRTTYTPIALN